MELEKEGCKAEEQSWLKEIRKLREENVREQLDVTEVQYFVLGEGCICGVANEVMCEFALNLSQNLHWEYFYFGGYTNGCVGYFPEEGEFDKGGFEIYWSMLIYYAYYNRVCPLKRESARILTEFVMQHAPKQIE